MRWETALLAVLGIMGPIFAQSTRPEISHQMPTYPFESAPTRFRGEQIDGIDVFAHAIRSRDAIRSLDYRVHAIRVSERPGRIATYSSVQRIRGSLACFLIEIEGEYRGPGPDNSPIVSDWSHVALVHPRQLMLWRVGMSNPQRIYIPIHSNWQSLASTIEGGLSQAFVLQRWGFGWAGRTLESRAGDQSLRFFKTAESEGSLRYEVWYQADSGDWEFGSLIEIHKPSGLIQRTFAYDPQGRPYLATDCLFEQISDATDPSVMHWIPVRLHSERKGERFDATLSQVQINGPFDCDSLIDIAQKRLTTQNTKIFEMLSNGNTRGLVFRDGAWVEDGLGEIPFSGSATAAQEASAENARSADSPHAARETRWMVVALLGGSLLLITLGLIALLRNRRPT